MSSEERRPAANPQLSFLGTPEGAGAHAASASDILDSLAAHVVLLDRDGVIAQVNESWRRFAREHGWNAPGSGVGMGYLAVCDGARGAPGADAAGEGIRRVLHGRDAVFEMEYPCDTVAGSRWYRLLVTPWIRERVEGAVVMHLDVTPEVAARGRALRLHALLLAASETGAAIARAAGPRELLESACHALVEKGGLPLAWVRWLAPGAGAPGIEARWGADPQCREALATLDAGELPDGPGPEAAALRERRAAYSDDLAQAGTWFRAHAEPLGLRGCAALPIERDGRTVGTLVACSRDEDGFDAEARTLLEAIASNVSFALAAHERDGRWRESERTLRENDARITEAERIAQMGSWELTVPERRLVWSREVHRIFGVAPGAFAGTFEAFLALVHPDDRVALLRAQERALTDAAALDVEHRIVRADGEVRHVRERAQLVGRTRLVGTVQDITDLKRVERQFLRAERLETIATLAGGIGHDLNNALSPILLSLELLKGGGMDEPQAAQTLAAIEASALRGAEVVRQLLSLARGVEGRRVEVQVRHLIRDIEKIVRDTFPKNLQVRVLLPTRLWPVIGDPTQLHHAILSLCLNARDAMPTGGTLTLAAENLALDEHYSALEGEGATGPYLCVRVEDTGHGIPAAMVDRIFDPFFSTRERGSGSGLGLTTALAVVRNHGGFIRVQSDPGEGATFRVYLPAETGAGGAPAGREDPGAHRGRGELVLVVDDEAPVREVTRRTLESFGYRTLMAADGAEALVAFAQHRGEIAVVLTDMMMPLVDGTALMVALRRAEPGIRIVVMSGLGNERQRAGAADVGVRHFLEKPFTAAALLAVLRAALDSDH